MSGKAEEKKGYSRRFGDTITTGSGDIVMNGQTVKAQGRDIGNMAAVTAGLSNLKRRGGAVELNEENGNVMLGGSDTGVRASDFAGGIDDESMDALRKGYTKTTGDEIVRGRQSAESRGMGNMVRWDPSSKRMTIAGVDVPYLYITDDGNAMVSERTLNSVLEKVKQSSGVKTATELADMIYGKNKKAVSSALDKVTNRKQWSYSPESDPAYEAYERMYSRNAEQAYNRAMGSGGLYGAPDSYRMYQALAGYADNMQRLSDAVPELARQAYERYGDEQARNLAALEALRNERTAEYDMLSGANEKQLSRMREDDRENYSRHEDMLYNYPIAGEQTAQQRAKTRIADKEAKQTDIDTAMYSPMIELDYRIKNAQLDSVEVKTLISRIQAAQQRAVLYNGGRFMKQDMDALGIPQDMLRYPDSGGYPNPWDAEINAKLAEWYNYTLPTQYGIY